MAAPYIETLAGVDDLLVQSHGCIVSVRLHTFLISAFQTTGLPIFADGYAD